MDYYEVEHIINVVASYIVLHNFCELNGDTCDPEWVHHESTPSNTAASGTNTCTTTRNRTAKKIRDGLKDYLYNKCLITLYTTIE